MYLFEFIYLSSYARIVQSFDLVPIVEPEVLMDGNHDINKCFDVTSSSFTSTLSRIKKPRCLFRRHITQTKYGNIGKNVNHKQIQKLSLNLL